MKNINLMTTKFAHTKKVFAVGIKLAVLSSALLVVNHAQAQTNTGAADEVRADGSDVDIMEIKEELNKARRVKENVVAPAQADDTVSGHNLESESKRLLAAENELLAKMHNEEKKGDSAANPSMKTVSLDSSERASANVEKASDLDSAIDQLSAPKTKTNEVSDTGIEVIRNEKSKSAAAPARAVLEKNDLEPLEMSDHSPSVSAGSDDVDAKYATQVKALETLRTSQERMKNQLDSSQRKASQLQKELDETRNRLIVAETEVERLSSLLAERNKTSISKLTGAAPKSASLPSSPQRVQVTSQQESKMAPDMPIATVMVEKAHLRTGPGKDNSPLMAVSRGTRLAVETRNGEWYRVIAPTGARAWVQSDMLAFGPGAQEAPTRTVKIKGYQADALKDGLAR